MNELGVTCTYECIFTGSILLCTKSHIVIVVLRFYRDIFFYYNAIACNSGRYRSFLTGSCNGVEIQVTIYLIVGSLIRETKYWYKYILNWLIVCMLIYSKILHPYGNATIAGKRCRIWVYAQRLYPLTRESSLSCNTAERSRQFSHQLWPARDTEDLC